MDPGRLPTIVPSVLRLLAGVWGGFLLSNPPCKSRLPRATRISPSPFFLDLTDLCAYINSGSDTSLCEASAQIQATARKHPEMPAGITGFAGLRHYLT